MVPKRRLRFPAFVPILLSATQMGHQSILMLPHNEYSWKLLYWRFFLWPCVSLGGLEQLIRTAEFMNVTFRIRHLAVRNAVACQRAEISE